MSNIEYGFLQQMVTRDAKYNVTSTVDNYFHVENSIKKIKTWCENKTDFIKPIFLVHLYCVESNTLHRGLKEDTVTLPYGLYWKYHKNNRKLRALVKNQLKSPSKFASYMAKDWFRDEYYKQLICILNIEYTYKELMGVIDEKYHLLIFSYYYNAYNKHDIIHAIQKIIYDRINNSIVVDGILGNQTIDFIKKYINDYVGYSVLDGLKNNLFEMYEHKKNFNLNKNGWKNRLENAVKLTKIMYGKDR